MVTKIVRNACHQGYLETEKVVQKLSTSFSEALLDLVKPVWPSLVLVVGSSRSPEERPTGSSTPAFER